MCGAPSVKGSHTETVEYPLDEAGRLKEQMPRAARRLLSAKAVRPTRVVRLLGPEVHVMSPSSEATDDFDQWLSETHMDLEAGWLTTPCELMNE